MSQDSPSGQEATAAPSPFTVWPFKSSAMLSAPITIPLFGQFARSPASFVSVVIVSPQLSWLANAGPLPHANNAVTVRTAQSAPPRSNRWDPVLGTCVFIASPFARVCTTTPTLRPRAHIQQGVRPRSGEGAHLIWFNEIECRPHGVGGAPERSGVLDGPRLVGCRGPMRGLWGRRSASRCIRCSVRQGADARDVLQESGRSRRSRKRAGAPVR